MITDTEATDPRTGLLKELCAKIPDPAPDLNAYGWAKLELLGFRVIYGYLDQVEFGSSRVLRMRQPVRPTETQEDDRALELVEVGRYSSSAMYGCSPMTKMQMLSNLDWVRDLLAELWHSSRALPATAETQPAEESEPCASCRAPVGHPCSPTCDGWDAPGAGDALESAAASNQSSDGDLP